MLRSGMDGFILASEVAMIARLLSALFACRHELPSVRFRVQGVDYQRCTKCGQAVRAKVQTGPCELTGTPRRTQEAKTAEPDQRTGVERMADQGRAHDWWGVRL